MDGDKLYVIDIDIHKDKSVEEIVKIRLNLIDSPPPNVVTVADYFDIDEFAQMNKYKIENAQETKDLAQNRVVAPNTSIRETQNDQRFMFKYDAINDWENVSHLASLREILDKWNIDIEMSYKDYAQQQHDRIYGVQINDEGTIEQMNDELAQACVGWLKNLEIHNYPQPINMEVSLLSIF
ncbi:MAG: hypothetical protein EZS28_047665 [Streblomastix strix]|uniref:Uncharacterized protein n=1 Tax=Streblomastix strix TaxID=222440 RepID=A0A5J4TF25_9EUKA|nr:MAG: hypothetical protein EZS28_047665 [Streblomastix strix]